MSVFKTRNSFASRRAEFERISQRFPGRIPIIIEKATKSVDAPPLPKQKFLAPEAMTVGQFIYVVRRSMNLPPEKALFVFCGDILPTTATLVRELYHDHKDADGFLYFCYSSESTFGVGDASLPHTPCSEVGDASLPHTPCSEVGDAHNPHTPCHDNPCTCS